MRISEIDYGSGIKRQGSNHWRISKGLGKACAMALAKEGAKVTICARNETNFNAQQMKYEIHTTVRFCTNC